MWVYYVRTLLDGSQDVLICFCVFRECHDLCLYSLMINKHTYQYCTVILDSKGPIAYAQIREEISDKEA